MRLPYPAALSGKRGCACVKLAQASDTAARQIIRKRLDWRPYGFSGCCFGMTKRLLS